MFVCLLQGLPTKQSILGWTLISTFWALYVEGSS